MKVIHNSDVPIYRQIVDSMKTDILSGKFAPGERLPSIRALAQELGISVITTIKAYKTLQEEGVITAICGKGFFINEKNLEMLRKQHACKMEEVFAEMVRLAKQLGITEEEVLDGLKKTIEREW